MARRRTVHSVYNSAWPKMSELVSHILAQGPRDYFAVLSLPRAPVEASQVRKAYRGAALKVHPDKCSDPRATEAFKLLSEAFECLADPSLQQLHLGGGAGGRSGAGGGAAAPRATGKPWWERGWKDVEAYIARQEELFRARQQEQRRGGSRRDLQQKVPP